MCWLVVSLWISTEIELSEYQVPSSTTIPYCTQNSSIVQRKRNDCCNCKHRNRSLHVFLHTNDWTIKNIEYWIPIIVVPNTYKLPQYRWKSNMFEQLDSFPSLRHITFHCMYCILYICVHANTCKYMQQHLCIFATLHHFWRRAGNWWMCLELQGAPHLDQRATPLRRAASEHPTNGSRDRFANINTIIMMSIF